MTPEPLTAYQIFTLSPPPCFFPNHGQFAAPPKSPLFLVYAPQTFLWFVCACVNSFWEWQLIHHWRHPEIFFPLSLAELWYQMEEFHFLSLWAGSWLRG